MPSPCRLLVHTCHAAPLPCSNSALSFVKFGVVARYTQTVVQQFNRSSVLQCAATTLTVVGMDCCEEDVIIACGLYLLVEEEKWKKRKYWIHKVFRAREEEGGFPTLFGRMKDDRQKFFKYFRMSFSKFENLKQLLHRHWKEEYKMETEHKNRRNMGFNCKVSSEKCILTNLSTWSL